MDVKVCTSIETFGAKNVIVHVLDGVVLECILEPFTKTFDGLQRIKKVLVLVYLLPNLDKVDIFNSCNLEIHPSMKQHNHTIMVQMIFTNSSVAGFKYTGKGMDV